MIIAIVFKIKLILIITFKSHLLKNNKHNSNSNNNKCIINNKYKIKFNKIMNNHKSLSNKKIVNNILRALRDFSKDVRSN